MTTPVTFAITGLLVLVVCAVAWFGLHPFGSDAAKGKIAHHHHHRKNHHNKHHKKQLKKKKHKMGDASNPVVPVSVSDSNARMRLRYAWLAATDWARNHRLSYSGLTPGTEARLVHHSGVGVMLRGEGRLVLTRFDTAGRATWGVVSIRVASGTDLLLVTRSKSGRAFCFVQKGHSTGIGPGDTHSLAACSIRWG